MDRRWRLQIVGLRERGTCGPQPFPARVQPDLLERHDREQRDGDRAMARGGGGRQGAVGLGPGRFGSGRRGASHGSGRLCSLPEDVDRQRRRRELVLVRARSARQRGAARHERRRRRWPGFELARRRRSASRATRRPAPIRRTRRPRTGTISSTRRSPERPGRSRHRPDDDGSFVAGPT
jgi:hypothetical protein